MLSTHPGGSVGLGILSQLDYSHPTRDKLLILKGAELAQSILVRMGQVAPVLPVRSASRAILPVPCSL